NTFPGVPVHVRGWRGCAKNKVWTEVGALASGLQHRNPNPAIQKDRPGGDGFSGFQAAKAISEAYLLKYIFLRP
ncbi:MAG: hypothetical protein AAF361_13200, partial [Bacteroidota bacterium]